MLFLLTALLIMNCLAECLLNKMMMAMNVLDKKYIVYHTLCAVLRIVLILLGAWYTIPIPILLIGLFILLFLNVIPYRERRLLMNNFTLIIYLIYTSLLMAVIGGAGFIGFDLAYLGQTTMIRVIVMNAAFIIFNTICILLLHYHPEFMWREDFDKSKVMIYTCFLLICVIYHILDAVILTFYHASRINYLLLASGDILIMILMFNFLNYNYVFSKSEDMRREYEKSEIMIAQQYFEKESLKKLSEFDSLTKAYNRREISSIMAENIQNGHALACVFVDLDGLKRTNDKYGHTFGDLMLQRFADACMELLKGKGYLARVGGDEFLLIFLDQEANAIEGYIKELQLKLLEPDEEKEKVYFSYGISYGEDSVDNYIISADQRMYADKNRKRCGVI